MSKGDGEGTPNAGGVEFSRPLKVGQIAATGLRQHVEANAGEREAVARRLALQALDSLQGDVSVRARAGGRLIEVEGDLRASLTQQCVVTLEPVENVVEEHFLQRFTTDPDFAQADEIVIDVEEEDAPEPIEGEALDLGEALVQQLALALDPYPRAPGAELEWQEGDEEDSNPFAVLKHLKTGG
ncbi:MAG: DUF177 domain-containing protein [Rhodovibrionaceae bacterium]|nr:DUF177 domain-containing protein [Rhodovibrionaceae bacterium]